MGMIRYLAFILLLLLPACGSDLLSCENYEPGNSCTMHVDPVCAKLDTEYGYEWRSYSNACVACTQDTEGETVLGYKKGNCADQR